MITPLSQPTNEELAAAREIRQQQRECRDVNRSLTEHGIAAIIHKHNEGMREENNRLNRYATQMTGACHAGTATELQILTNALEQQRNLSADLAQERDQLRADNEKVKLELQAAIGILMKNGFTNVVVEIAERVPHVTEKLNSLLVENERLERENEGLRVMHKAEMKMRIAFGEALKFYSNIENFSVTVWKDETKDGECWTEPAKEHGLIEKPNADFGIKAEEVLESVMGKSTEEKK